MKNNLDQEWFLRIWFFCQRQIFEILQYLGMIFLFNLFFSKKISCTKLHFGTPKNLSEQTQLDPWWLMTL